jgi:hypothetical protein
MREQDLDSLLKTHYSDVKLSESKMAHILNNTPEKDNVVAFYAKPWFTYAAAACIAFFIVSVVLNRAVQPTGGVSQIELASSVIGIYDNHYSPDVFSTDFNSIAQGLDHSDFSIVPTKAGALEGYEVRGGRRCGLNGLKAVHVVLYNHNSKKEGCLYVLPDSDDFKSIKDAFVEVADQEVFIWHDNGRLFALYEPR